MSKVFKSIARELNAGSILAVYIVVGDEEWGKSKFLKLLKKVAVDPSMMEFNFDLLQANETKGLQVVDKAGMLPMMADRRLILVEGCEVWKKKDLDAITKYVEKPNESTTLVLLFNNADQRKKIFKISNANVMKLSFLRPKRWELNDFIAELVRDMKLRMNNEAIELIAELVGDDLTKVHQELEKLTLYKLGSNEISSQDVELLMGRTRQVTRWELNDFIGRRDLGATMTKMHDIMDCGEEPISLLSAINNCIKQLMGAKTLMTRGVRDKSRIASALGVPPKIAESLMEQQKSYSDPELRRAFLLMKDTDFRLKSSGMNRRLIMDHLISQILLPSELSPPQIRRRYNI